MNVTVYGKKGYAALVADIAAQCGHSVVGFVDDSDARDADFVLGVGYADLPRRAALLKRLRSMVPLIHPRACVRNPALVGPGAVVMAGATVDLNAVIGSGAVLWNGATVIHDCVIGENTFVGPGATVCGDTVIGRDCFIGAGAVVVDHRTVPDGTFVKAGTVFK